MIKGIYTAASAMLPRITKQETIANNLANVNTPGYKRESVFLRQLTREQMRTANKSEGWQTPMIDKKYTDFSHGSLEHTGDNLNFAIDGDGFFVLQTENGEAFTRDGNFHLTPEGVLVNADNLPVLSDSGQIVIDGRDFAISTDGIVSVEGEEIGRMRMVDFEKPYQLEKLSSGLFQPHPDTQQVEIEFTYIRQGYLEKSNVDIIREMVDMIASYRNYESDHKAIQILDESLNKTVNEVGRIR